MEDSRIVDLYWSRSENAITETMTKYGKYCYRIAFSILANNEDTNESVNDTYMKAWNSMPPNRPSVLSTFLGKITRRVSIDKWRSRIADKRGGGEIELAIDELSECILAGNSVEREIKTVELAKIINNFIKTIPLTEKRVFICRYWYLDSISSICQQFGFTESKVKSMLYRIRGKLLTYLKKEGAYLDS